MSNKHTKNVQYHWAKVIHIKTTRQHVTSSRMTRINKQDNKCCQRYGELGVLKNYSWECKIVLSLCKTVWKFLKRLNEEFSYASNITLRYIPKRNENICPHKNVCTNVHHSIIHNRPNLKRIFGIGMNCQICWHMECTLVK